MNALAKRLFNPQCNREVAISVVHTFADVVKITADVCPDPVASAVLKTVFAIYEEVMKVSELKDRIKNLGLSINALSDIIARIQTTKSVLDGQSITEDNKVVRELEELSKEILEKLNKWNGYSGFRAWVNLRHLTKSLDTYQERIQEMSGVYEMANSAIIVTNLQRANEILNQCHKLMKDIFVDRSAAKKLEEVQRLLEEAENTPEPYVIEEVCAPGISTELCPVKQRRCDGSKEYVAKRIKFFQPEKHAFVRKKLDACIKHFENLPPHPNIMKAREVVETTYGVYNRSAFFVISEKQPCNLFDFCEKDENKNFNVFTLLAETAEALVHMHKHSVAHGCVRGANILVSAEGRAIVHDFELTRFFTDRHDYPDIELDRIWEHEDLATNRLNTVGRWMCPEIFASDAPGWETVEFLVQKEWQTPEGDVWSFGMLILELFTKRRPYNSQRAPGYFYKTILMRELPEFPDREEWEQVPWMSQEVFDFMLEMFAIDWNKRPTMQCVAERMRKLEKEYVPRK